MDISTVERHTSVVQQGRCVISIIISTFCLTFFKPFEILLMEIFFMSISELYFLVAKFLLESPFKNAGQVR